ncbi:type IV toxin-antitoxin system AbiEi family antitoxin domain-containing protein [Rhizobium puerariae]|uniref:Type IV toxin-antitoxin system AbiEi family antitoxin domain-containing protein n=1 Tax=Rhizobium puerariae TaxID=1585791 RepID=A0ABV6AK50_9HYPH
MKSLELEFTGAEMAAILGLSDRRIRQLADEGVIERAAERGKYLLHPSISRYTQTLEARRDPAVQELNQKKAKLIEIEIAKRDGRLVELEEAMHVVERMAGSFVAALDGLAARASAEIAGRSDQRRYAEARRSLETIVDAVRAELVEKFGEISAELHGGKAA